MGLFYTLPPEQSEPKLQVSLLSNCPRTAHMVLKISVRYLGRGPNETWAGDMYVWGVVGVGGWGWEEAGIVLGLNGIARSVYPEHHTPLHRMRHMYIFNLYRTALFISTPQLNQRVKKDTLAAAAVTKK